ncbi:tRNA 2-selenouridine(34) synthase MnmH [Spirosoma flavus]
MIKAISISDFLRFDDPIPLADVRTPAEFTHGHIPGAFNLPLFSNEERVQVGTTYKQVGREAAILLGFDLTGPKWSGFIRQALDMAPDKKIAVHCWRGGMRSGAMAWALSLYGFEVYLIEGGYKQYRRWVLEQFAAVFQLVILGGMTGSGKTRILQQLQAMDQQVIDLEDLAQHQGSSYGTLNRLIQPTQEQFENNLADTLKKLDRQRPIWVEDESLKIGKLIIPNPFWRQMGAAVLIDIQVDLERRIANLVDEYGKLDKDFLITCTQRIHKQLGPLQTKQSVAAIQENRMEDFIRLALVYYDKSYRNGLSRRNEDQVFSLLLSNSDTIYCAEQLVEFSTSVLKNSVQTNEYTNG